MWEKTLANKFAYADSLFSLGRRKLSYFKVNCWTTRAKLVSKSSMCVCFMVVPKCPTVENAEVGMVTGLRFWTEILVWKQLVMQEDWWVWLVLPLSFDASVLGVTALAAEVAEYPCQVELSSPSCWIKISLLLSHVDNGSAEPEKHMWCHFSCSSKESSCHQSWHPMQPPLLPPGGLGDSSLAVRVSDGCHNIATAEGQAKMVLQPLGPEVACHNAGLPQEPHNHVVLVQLLWQSLAENLELEAQTQQGAKGVNFGAGLCSACRTCGPTNFSYD